MIFAMVGMHDSGFERLIRALDSFAKGNPEERLKIQIGSSQFIPSYAEHFSFKADLHEEIEQADLVIAHGSFCIVEALQKGKRLIVVPRQAKFAEAIDDHQLEFTTSLSRKYGFPVILDCAELNATIHEQMLQKNPKPIETKRSLLYTKVKEYIDELDDRQK